MISYKDKFFLLLITYLFGLFVLDEELMLTSVNYVIKPNDTVFSQNDTVFSQNDTVSSQNDTVSSLDSSIKDEKFLTYLPHSQFGNQLVELQNAIVLAYLTNRTLIVPSILRFKPGGPKIPYSFFYNLYSKLNSFTNIKKDRMLCYEELQHNTKHCSLKYSKYDGFEMINWEEIFDFSWIKNNVKIIHRGFDFSIKGLFRICDIPMNKTTTSSIQDLLENNENV